MTSENATGCRAGNEEAQLSESLLHGLSTVLDLVAEPVRRLHGVADPARLTGVAEAALRAVGPSPSWDLPLGVDASEGDLLARLGHGLGSCSPKGMPYVERAPWTVLGHCLSLVTLSVLAVTASSLRRWR